MNTKESVIETDKPVQPRVDDSLRLHGAGGKGGRPSPFQAMFVRTAVDGPGKLTEDRKRIAPIPRRPPTDSDTEQIVTLSK